MRLYMRTMTPVLLGLALMATISGADAKTYYFDLGSEQSPIQEGFTQITPQTIFPANPAGWTRSETLETRDQPYEEFTAGDNTKTPPPIWTTPLSQDAISGTKPVDFVAQVEPGKYHAWILCGTSVADSAQVFFFDVSVGQKTRRMLFENNYQFRDAYLDLDADNGEARLRFAPRNRFMVAAIVLWQDADDKQVRDLIRREREVVDSMPPAEMKKWILDVREPDSSPWPAVAEADRARGYLVHYRHWAENVYPYTVPLAQEINPTLRAFGTPGEYEPLNFIVYPFRSFSSATVKVSDLKSQSGIIPASNIEIRRVKYMLARPNYRVLYQYRVVPDALVAYDPNQPLTQSENTRYWLTVHVPADAKPGLYKGSVIFTPSGSTTATIPVIFRVLPITLREDPSKLYAIYYHDPLDSWANAKDEISKAFYLRKSDYELDDLIAHGTRNVTTGLWAAPEKPGEEGKFSFNFDFFQMKIDRWKQHGFKGPIVLGINAGGIYRKYTGQDLSTHISDATPPPPEYGKELTRMCAVIEAERVKRGWPEFLYYPVDEPGSNPGAIAFMIETLKAVRAAGVRTYVTADPTIEGYAPLKPYIDVWSTQPFLPTRDEILKDEAARKVDYWCYPNHVNGENDHTTVNGARMTYGFGFWRSGFTALIPWIYRADIGNPWNYLDGRMSDFFNRAEDNGRPVPVAMWEAYREGYDDYRYVYTLQQLIAAGMKQGGKAAKAAAATQKDLDYVWKQIRVQPKYKYDDLWEPREVDVYRWIVANQILTLQAAGIK